MPYTKKGNPNWHKGMESPNPYGAAGFPKQMGYGVKTYTVAKKKGNNPYGRSGKPKFFDIVAKGAQEFLRSPFSN